ncbi:hypothetical protein EUTSA_v10007642mg [Eutrema salsugineum]|uniref:F-box domain-containing protein n=1 Tax=Eutrema salsugineum TaxID=72664 RepID=V4KQ43_EUTSA|nr:hypothetical protein EUTSA_v10007642mg [Eutrema salsugineum]
MEEYIEKRVCARGSGYRIGEVDRLSNLPDCLLFEILTNLPTKDVVKFSVLSSRWRNLWRYVPGLDPTQEMSCIQKFRLNRNNDVKLDITHFTRWINTVVERKVKHLHVLDSIRGWLQDKVRISPTVYTCESLVSLNLYDIWLPNPESVSLPFLKDIVLDTVEFEDDRAFEMLISGCPVLECLSISVDYYSNNEVIVCSQSLLSFTYVGYHFLGWIQNQEAVIDAPRLERVRLSDRHTASFIVKNLGSLVEADTDIVFNLGFDKNFWFEEKLDANDLPKREMIRNFLVGISCVKDIKISSSTLQITYDYSRCESLPLFINISFLRVEFFDNPWEILPIFLESCPNIKSLTLGFIKSPREEGVGSMVPAPRRFLVSLEYVKIVKPMAAEATETQLKLVSYFLENSTILKKLTLCLGDFGDKEESVFIKKLLTIPRLSSSCQVYVL